MLNRGNARLPLFHKGDLAKVFHNEKLGGGVVFFIQVKMDAAVRFDDKTRATIKTALQKVPGVEAKATEFSRPFVDVQLKADGLAKFEEIRKALDVAVK